MLRRALAESSAMAHSAEAALPPLISMRKNFDDLAAEYARGTRADLYRAKARHLEGHYQALRRVRGDGNCFYRGFHVSWMERLLQLPEGEQSRVWLRVVPEATQVYLDSLPEGPLRAQLEFLGKEFAERTREMCVAARAGSAESTLLDAENNPTEMEQSLQWLRLLTSAYMRRNSDMFEPVCADGTRSFDAFLEAEVETMGVEADEMQVQALTAALQLRVRVEYLDAASTPWSTRSGVHRFLICGPPTLREGSADAQSAHEERTKLVACLLFRPGHYDVLSPKDWEKMDDETEPRAAFVAPVPPDHKPAAPDDRCGHCSQPLLGCWLCGRWVCRGPNSKCARFGLAPGAQDAAAPSNGSSGSLLRSLLHPLPDSFGKPGQSGAVCPSCLENCPAASTLKGEGAAYCADKFTLTHCVCGHLEFAPSMPEHMETCVYEKSRAASQAPSQAALQAQSVAEPAAPQQPIVGAAVGAATAVAAGSAAGPSGSLYPSVFATTDGPSGSAPSASTDPKPLVMRAPSSVSDDDPMTGTGDERLVAGTGMDQAPDTDSHEAFHHVTREEATGADPNTPGTTAKSVAADTSVLAHASIPEHQPRLPAPSLRAGYTGSPASIDAGAMPSGFPPERPSPAAPAPPAPAAAAQAPEPSSASTSDAAASSSSAPPTTDELVDTLMALGLGIERADAVDALRYAQGDVEAAAHNLFASNEAEANGRRTRLAAQREAEAAQEQIRRADEAQRRADEAQRSANLDRQLAETRERNAVEDVARRERWAAEEVGRQADRQEIQQRMAAERLQREKQQYEAERQRRAAEAAATQARREDEEQARLRQSEARLAEARQREDLGREQREQAAYERNVTDLVLYPQMHADRLAAEFQVSPQAALRAVQAAIKNRGDLNDAATLLFEPEEVDWILTSTAVEKKFPCRHCGRRFGTFNAYQRHNDARLTHPKGLCPGQQPQSRPKAGTPGGIIDGISQFTNSVGRGIVDVFTGEAFCEPPPREVVCPHGVCQRYITIRSPQPGMTYTCPHCRGTLKLNY